MSNQAMTKQQQQTPTMLSSSNSSSNGVRETRSMTDGNPSHTLQEDIEKRKSNSRKTQKAKLNTVDNEGYTLVQRKKSSLKGSSPKKSPKISSFFTSKNKEEKPNYTENKMDDKTIPKPSVNRSSLSPVRSGVSYLETASPPTSPKNPKLLLAGDAKEEMLKEATNKVKHSYNNNASSSQPKNSTQGKTHTSEQQLNPTVINDSENTIEKIMTNTLMVQSPQSLQIRLQIRTLPPF